MSAKTTFIATGDSFITRRLPEGGYPGFGEVQAIIEHHDVKFCNFEMTAHENEGYPAAFSGGTWAMADPSVLDDLNLYGFNLYNTANNHSHDFSHGGILATIENLKAREMLFAGTGANLAEASAPCYLECQNARVAMIAVSSSFHESGAAGAQRFDMQGRPGLNPLRFKTTYHVEQPDFDALQSIAQKTGINASLNKGIKNGYAPPPPEGSFIFGGIHFALDTKNEEHTAPLEADMQRIIYEIEEAKRQADYVLVSLHAHEFKDGDGAKAAEFIETFSRRCIDAGACAILGHGPHELRGVEIYKGGVIFYSLGNFIFQTETVATQPADAYEKHGLSNLSKVGEYMNNRSKNGTRGYGVQPNIWRAVMGAFSAEDGRITQVQLYPVTLDMELPRSRKGWPRLLKDNSVLEYLDELSQPYGTKMRIENGVGYIDL